MLIVGIIIAIVLSYTTWKITFYKSCERILEEKRRGDKFFAMYAMTEKWLQGIYEEKPLGKYIKEMGWKTVAIYGCAELGNRLYDELNNNQIEVLYGIDRNINLSFPVKIYSVNEIKSLKQPDVVIVTSIAYFSAIEETLRGQVDTTIVSLEDIVYENLY